MNKRDFTQLHDEWIASFAIPTGLDARSYAIRKFGLQQVLNHEPTEQPDFGWIMAMDMVKRGWQSTLIHQDSFRWIRHATRLLAMEVIDPGKDADLIAVNQAIRMNRQA